MLSRLLLPCLLLLPPAGCESTPQAGTLNQALTEYDAGEYALAHRHASDAMRCPDDQKREEAAYLAGLSAYRLGRLDDAERLLLTASRSEKPTTAARAKATLGLIRLDQDRPREAAGLFREAEPHLAGSDAQQAARYADAACRMAGLAPPPRTAGPSPRSPSGPSDGAAGPSSTFTLQVGAFQDRRRAERAAADAAPVAESAGLGRVRVIPRSNGRGRQLYVVQLGRFGSRREAAAARTRLAHSDYIVVPAADRAH
jgi:hypothetical protein